MQTVKLILLIISPHTDSGVITIPEETIIKKNLRNLSQKGELAPVVIPKLINMNEVAELLSISVASFKIYEKEGRFSFKRKMIGGAVRYRNIEVIEYLLNNDEDTDN